MESLITYRNEAFKKDIGIIREKSDHPYRLLNEATMKFISTLEDIEKRYLNSQETPEELLNAITMATTNINHVCEQFERRVGHDSDIIKEARIEFRKKTDHVLSNSYVVNRTRTWPQRDSGRPTLGVRWVSRTSRRRPPWRPSSPTSSARWPRSRPGWRRSRRRPKGRCGSWRGRNGVSSRR